MVPTPPETVDDADLTCLTTAWRFLPVYIKTAILALLDAAFRNKTIFFPSRKS
jgi:hypothetical protein